MRAVGVSGILLPGLDRAVASALLATARITWTLPAAMVMSAGCLPEGVSVRAIGSGLTVPADCPDDSRLRRELDRLRRCIDLAVDTGVPVVAITTGPAGQLRWEDALDQRHHDLAEVVAHARQAGVTLTLENTHSLRSDVSFLHSLHDTVTAARVLGMQVCADFYCCWAEPALAETLVDAADLITTVQYADFVHGTLAQPNRWVPGDGDLPVNQLVAAVVASGYQGAHEIEVLGPQIDHEGPVAALQRSVNWLRERLHGLEALAPAARRTRDQRVHDTVTALRGR